jgi:hypothetical protein
LGSHLSDLSRSLTARSLPLRLQPPISYLPFPKSCQPPAPRIVETLTLITGSRLCSWPILQRWDLLAPSILDSSKSSLPLAALSLPPGRRPPFWILMLYGSWC